MADAPGQPVPQRHPAEVTQLAAARVTAVARYAGAVEVGGALVIAHEAAPLATVGPQGVVHVAENHQRHRPAAADLLDRQGEVLVAPVAGGALPVAAAGIGGAAAEPGRPGVGQQHQRQRRISGQGCAGDAVGRFLLAHRSVDRTHRPRQMEAAAGRARAPPHHRQPGGPQFAQGPAAVVIRQHGQLLAQAFAAGIAASVVIAGNAGQRQLQLGKQARYAGQAIAEVANQQQRIGPQPLQKVVIDPVPLVVEIAGDGEVEVGQAGWLPRLVFILPEPRRRLVFTQVPPQPPTTRGLPACHELPAAIGALRRQRKAVILAHYYQEDAIQDIADFIGDSLELSRKAASTDAEVIVFCGVHFMAETAKILNPSKTVLVPDLEAGCSLADDCPSEAFAAFRADHPDHTVVSYINCSAAVKAQSDLICTSSNAVQLVQQLPVDRPILFAPDQNLGRWVARQSGRELTLWPGSCIVHDTFSEQALLQLSQEHPGAEVIAHPECQQHLLDLADFIGSTSKLLQRAEQSSATSFIVLTEPGILHQMRLRVPHKQFFEVPGADGCSCNACPYMRLNTLEKLWQCLHDMAPEIVMDEELRLKALAPIERMLAMSR